MGFISNLVVTNFLQWITLLMSVTYAFDNSKLPFVGDSMKEPMEDNRIVGGEEASIDMYPHQAGMVINNAFFCGCFIIDEYWIVTAAHCVENTSPSGLLVRAGSSWRNNGTEIFIEEIYSHPSYDNPEFDNDVAVLKTTAPIEFTDNIQAIKLAPRDRVLETGSNIKVSGWGRTVQGATSLPDRLMHVTIPVVSRLNCRMSYPYYFTENMWCGGNFYLGGKGTCQGDSGGPAVQDGMVVGIVSFGRGCGQPLSPSVFADISAPSIWDFITNTTGL